MKGSSSAQEILEFLRRLPLFADLEEASLRSLATSARVRSMSKGEILFFESDAAESVFLIRSGTVSIVLNSPDGREMVIDEVRTGGIFGELELITGQPHYANAVARTNGELVVIPPGPFLRRLDEEACLARRVLELTGHRLQASVQRQMAFAFLNANARLARILLALDEQQQEKGYVTISQEELAHQAGVIRQTVAKAFGEWRRAGWLLTGRGRIVILDRKALERVEKGRSV